MLKAGITFVVFAIAGAALWPALAQQTPPASPLDKAGAVVAGGRVTIYYSRPYTKDPKKGDMRKIWGGLVPWGKAWRTGANEATLLVTEYPMVIGGKTIPAGAYSLYTVPMEKGPSKLVLSKKVGQAGTMPDGSVDESNDFARFDMKKDSLPKSVDQFTIVVEPKNPDKKATDGPGVIKLMWENTQFSVEFTVNAKK